MGGFIVEHILIYAANSLELSYFQMRFQGNHQPLNVVLLRYHKLILFIKLKNKISTS